MLARCAPRAMTLTSSPAWASLAAKRPPIAPAPITHIFTNECPFVRGGDALDDVMVVSASNARGALSHYRTVDTAGADLGHHRWLRLKSLNGKSTDNLTRPHAEKYRDAGPTIFRIGGGRAPPPRDLLGANAGTDEIDES